MNELNRKLTKKYYWENFQLNDSPQTCFICGSTVTIENCGAMGFGWYGQTIVCCDDSDDLRHFKIFVTDRKLNWVKFKR